MKKAIPFIVCIIVLSAACFCSAETLTYRNFSADSESEYLNLDEADISPIKWESFYNFLSQFPNLKKVDMFNYPAYYNVVHEIHRRFPDVDFGMTMRFSEHTLRTDATAFSTLHDNAKWHSCAQLSVVKYCKNLYALDIGHNRFDDLSFLYDMPQLRVLIVACGDAKDITPIGTLEHLEYLELFFNRIEDISCLKDMKYLMDLNIVNNLIDDIEPLKNIKSLKRLWIHERSRRKQRPEDPAYMAELQAALPDCHIDWVSTSTAGGWRKHPHFQVIYRMFRSRVYEPFEDSPPENIPEGFAPHT